MVLALVIMALAYQAPHRGIDPDELEHVHAACAVSWGQTPYRDFFEHHGPALYYGLAPLLRVTGADLPAIWWGRAAMLAISAATLYLVARLARHTLAGRRLPNAADTAGSARPGLGECLAAPALLCVTTIFCSKSLEVRPDVPAAMLTTLAALLAVGAGRDLGRRALVIGLVMGLATLFTQKAIVPAAALGLSMLVEAWNERAGRSRRVATLIAGTACGGIVMWAIAAGLFAWAGAARAFWHGTVLQLWAWPQRHPPLETLRGTLTADMPLWFAAAAGVAGVLVSRRGGRSSQGQGSQDMGSQGSDPDDSQRGYALLARTVLVSMVCVAVVKAAYAQYYLLWFPLAAVVAARPLIQWARGPLDRWAAWSIAAVGAAVFAVQGCLLLRTIDAGPLGAAPQWAARVSPGGMACVFGAWLVVTAVAAAACLALARRAGAVVAVVAMSLSYAALRNTDGLLWSNHTQVEAIARVQQLVGPEETVLDGFSGLGAFRRHAWYYWWVNRYSLAFVSPEQRREGLLESLNRSPPKLVILDEHLRLLPEEVIAWIERRYRPIEPPLWVRIEPAGVREE